jgi:hypothetical protein
MGSRRRGALLVALVFLLQWVTSVWTASAMPLGAQFDVFGNSICATGPGSPPSNTGGDHAKVTACCTAGCHLASSTLDEGADNASSFAVPGFIIDHAQLVGRGSIVLSRHHDPGRPRAPPHFII